jgi:hypothetical protein
MKDIKIKSHKKVYSQYIINDHDLVDFLNKRNKNKNIQTGGGKVDIRKIKYKYDNKIFKLYEKEVDDGYDISVHRTDDLENPQTCLHIMINTEFLLAYIQNISYYEDCVSTLLEHPGGGSILLKMCIEFLKDTQSRYNVKRIQLKDNSYFTCFENNEKIGLALLHTLIHGETWYGKYGFRPYKPYNDTRDETLYKFYKNNRNIVRNTKVKDTNLFHYINRIIKKKVGNDSKKEDDLIVDFFKKYLLKFQHSCKGFSEFYMEFAQDSGIYDFNGKSFYLDI